jgi:hypothetical protein
MRPFPHSRSLIAGLLLGLAAMPALPASAQAQRLAAIRAHIAAANPGCEVTRLDEAHRGAVAGAAGHVVVAVFTVEGCGGGNNWASQLGVFSEEAGRVIEYALPDPPGFVVDSARVSKGIIAVNGLDYAPDDGRCCPSLRVAARYRIEGRRVTPMR